MSDIEARVDVLETRVDFFEKTTNSITKKVDAIVSDTQYIKGKMLVMCNPKENSFYVEIIKYLIVLIGAMVGVRFIL